MVVVMRTVLAATLVVFGIAPPSSAAAHPHGMSDAIKVYRAAVEPQRLGIAVTPMTPELRKFFGAPADVGILVSRIEDGSAAERARIRVGDVIIRVGDEDIDDASDVRGALSGEDVVVVLVRKKKTIKKKVELGGDEPRGGDLEDELRRTRDQIRRIERRLEKLERSRSGKSKAKRKKKTKTKD